MQKLLKEFKSELFPRLVPLGTALGVPFVFQEASGLYAIIPLLKKVSSEKDRIIIGSPVGELIFNLIERKLVAFHLFSYSNPFPNAPGTSAFAQFPPKIVYKMGLSRPDYEALREKLLAKIDDLVKSFEENANFTVLYAQYKSLFNDLIEEGMDKFYNSRCPKIQSRNSAIQSNIYRSPLDD